MGQKVNPHGLRVGIIKNWDSVWYADKDKFADLIVEDKKIRDYIYKDYYSAGISRVYIDRTGDEKISVQIFTAKPGMVVGKGGATVKAIRENVAKMTGKTVRVDIAEVKNPDSDAKLLAENVAQSIERRISFRRAMKQAISRSMRINDVEGVKIQVSGRLNGADMARTEGYSEGNVPLSTLRADIDYGFAESDTTYGKIGVKVWLYKGEILTDPGEGRKLIRKEPKPRRKGTRRSNNNRRRNNPNKSRSKDNK